MSADEMAEMISLGYARHPGAALNYPGARMRMNGLRGAARGLGQVTPIPTMYDAGRSFARSSGALQAPGGKP